MSLRIRCLLYLLFIPLLFSIVVSAASPAISDIYPANGATGIPLDNGKVYLRANITDADKDLAYVTFETNKSGSWVKIADVTTSGMNWTTSMPVVFSDLTYNTRYWWRVKAKDNAGHWTNSTEMYFTTGEQSSGNTISIVPLQPKANRKIIFIIDKTTASGYVICHETTNVYLLEVNNGIGMVELGLEYGTAEVIIPKYGSKTFTITSPYTQDDLELIMPSNANAGDNVEINMQAQGEPIKTTLSFKSPSGDVTTRKTGANPMSFSFNKAGDWEVSATIYGMEVKQTITITAKPLKITVSSENDIGDTVNIETSPYATVKIKKDALTYEYEADDEGMVYFEPQFPGEYSATAKLDAQEGTKKFTVQAPTTISVTDDKNLPLMKISEGTPVYVKVTDSAGTPVGSSSITIYADETLRASIPLYGGTAIWKADAPATSYHFSFQSSDDLYLPASISIEGGGGGMLMNVDALYIYIAIAIIGIIVALYILHKKGMIQLPIPGINIGGLMDKEEDLL